VDPVKSDSCVIVVGGYVPARGCRVHFLLCSPLLLFRSCSVDRQSWLQLSRLVLLSSALDFLLAALMTDAPFFCMAPRNSQQGNSLVVGWLD